MVEGPSGSRGQGVGDGLGVVSQIFLPISDFDESLSVKIVLNTF